MKRDDTYSVFSGVVNRFLNEIDNKHVDGVFIKDANLDVWGIGITEMNTVIYDGVITAYPFPLRTVPFNNIDNI